MANLRRSLTALQDLTPDAVSRRRNGPWRWLLIVGIVMLVLIVFAWIDGGEEPQRTIAEPVILPEQQP